MASRSLTLPRGQTRHLVCSSCHRRCDAAGEAELARATRVLREAAVVGVLEEEAAFERSLQHLLHEWRLQGAGRRANGARPPGGGGGEVKKLGHAKRPKVPTLLSDALRRQLQHRLALDYELYRNASAVAFLICRWWVTPEASQMVRCWNLPTVVT